MIFDRGCRKIAEVIIIGKDKDIRGAIMIAAEESLWSTEVPHLSLLFPMFLFNCDLRVHQNCLLVHLILRLVYLPPTEVHHEGLKLQSICNVHSQACNGMC